MIKKRHSKKSIWDLPWTPFEPAGNGPFGEEVYVNSKYQVNVTRHASKGEGLPPMVELSIKDKQKSARHDWRDLQRIKNELLGAEWEGVELYPAESRLVDTANQYFMWCVPPEWRFPFGFDEGRFVSEETVLNAKQRPFPADNRPTDLFTREELEKRVGRDKWKMLEEHYEKD